MAAPIPFTVYASVPSGLADELYVMLQWASLGATSYQIRRNTTTVIGITHDATFYDRAVTTGRTYSYTVVAYNNRGTIVAQSTPVYVTVPSRMPKPSIVELSQTQTSVTLSISATPVEGVTPGTIRLLRNGVDVGATHSADGSIWTYTDIALITHQTYTYSAYVDSNVANYYDSTNATLKVFIGREYTAVERQRDYLLMLRQPFTKLCRLRFLNPNGTTAFALDNNRRNKRSKAFIADGSVTANLQNGQRLTASVTLANLDGAFDFAYNKIWFGQQIALDEGLVLSNGDEYWRQTGVFIIDNPDERIDPNSRTVTYNLVDKWADLDGTLDGNLEGTYEVSVGTNIYTPIVALFAEDRGNGQAVDYVRPVFTEYYNGKTQELPDGSTVSMVLSPYTLTIDGEGGTIGAVVLGLAGMVNAWVGYDNTGRLRIDPSQDDIADSQKAVLYRFTPEEVTLLGLSYAVKKEDVFNDYIIVGEQMDDYRQPSGRAENYDPTSDTNIDLIGRKTKRESASGYATDTQCMDLAAWKLKRSGVLQKAVNVSCSQMFHIELNSLVEIIRTDKPGNPVERHLIQGYSRPLSWNGPMTISAVSVNDYPAATVSTWNPT